MQRRNKSNSGRTLSARQERSKRNGLPFADDSKVVLDALVVDITSWLKERHLYFGVTNVRGGGRHQTLERRSEASRSLVEAKHGFVYARRISKKERGERAWRWKRPRCVDAVRLGTKECDSLEPNSLTRTGQLESRRFKNLRFRPS